MQKKRKRSSIFVGSIVIMLAVFGIVAIIVSVTLGFVRKAQLKENESYAEYEKLICSVIMNDPDTFDDITKANMQQLISISIWSILDSDLEPDTFEYTDSGMLIPQKAVAEKFSSLFGTEVKIVHSSADGGDGIEFSYSENKKCYIIPITGITPIYTPKILDAKEKSGSVVLTVGYLASTDWQQDSKGNMVPPEPGKIMKITLGKNADDTYYVRAIQNEMAG